MSKKEPKLDKAYFELQIADLNRKLADLRTLTKELQDANEKLEQEYTKMEEDRNDVSIYLRRMLTDKNQDITMLRERLENLEMILDSERLNYKKCTIEMKSNHKLMEEELSSEAKLLSGKMNSLEEFRQQKDELMQKCVNQEVFLEEQEIKNKEELYEIEKGFATAKDKLKKDMQARLKQLSNDFQEVTEVRIASTTQKVIGENIVANNKLDALVVNNKRLYEDNVKLKDRNKIYKLEVDLHLAEKKKAFKKTGLQRKLIENFTKDIENLRKKFPEYQIIEIEVNKIKEELQKMSEVNKTLKQNKRILEQNLHASRFERGTMKTEFDYTKEEFDRISSIMKDCLLCIKTALVSQNDSEDIEKLATSRKSLLKQLYEMLSKVRGEKLKKLSLTSIDPTSLIYKKGDLAFIPKPVVFQSKVPKKRHLEIQVGPSFEDFVAQFKLLSETASTSEKTDVSDTSIISDKEEIPIEPKLPPPESPPPKSPPPKRIKTIFDTSSESSSSNSNSIEN